MLEDDATAFWGCYPSLGNKSGERYICKFTYWNNDNKGHFTVCKYPHGFNKLDLEISKVLTGNDL